jgi:hypothetical protein
MNETRRKLETYIIFRPGLKGRDHLEEKDIDEKILWK